MSSPLEGSDGFSAEQIFRNKFVCRSYTYDDILLLPGIKAFGTVPNPLTHYLSYPGHRPRISASDVDLGTSITRTIRLRVNYYCVW